MTHKVGKWHGLEGSEVSTSWTKNIFIYYDDDEAWDGTCDHVKTNEAKRTLALLF